MGRPLGKKDKQNLQNQKIVSPALNPKLTLLKLIKMAKKFYITTPIYYVNDKPHIGHTCTTVAVDIVARYQKLLGKKVFFLTGTDEHGAKVAEAAEKANLSPKRFCDKISLIFKNIWPRLNIQYDYFVRTTNPKHEKIVQEVIEKIYKKGDIYKAKYEGLYCVGCEKFITESELADGKCPLHPNKKIQKQSEENYFFKLSKYVPQLIKSIENKNDKNHYQISPPEKRKEILSKLKTGINDLSISRANVPWGITIPWDKTQTIYVWIDALLNYYSALKITDKEKLWPADTHFVAKDIFWFHTVIWEAMLLSAGLPLPREVFVHSFYTIDGQKMSKSLGNVITPEALLKKFGVDGTRYLIASSFPYTNDRDVGWQKFTEKYNTDLANGLGNLVSRVAKLCQNSDFSFKSTKVSLCKRYQKYMEKYQFELALDRVWQFISQADRKINQEKIWEQKDEKLRQSLQSLANQVRRIAYHLRPFLPETTEKIEKQFQGPKIKAEKPLFPRIK